MVVEFECIKCRKTVSLEQYESSKFCPECGTFLRARRLKEPTFPKKIDPVEIQRDQVDVESLFYEYECYSPIDVGGGVYFKDVSSWVRARKRKYKEYSEIFSSNNLHDLNYVVKKYEEWLLFRNNLSWTTLHRTGYYASKNPERLADLLFMLQDESLSIAERVNRGLRGKNKVYGIGPGILTGLLHTFFPKKYGVWNNRTKDTLEILRRQPIRSTFRRGLGTKYKEVNRELRLLGKTLKTDLTTLDGFMWYISKFVRFL